MDADGSSRRSHLVRRTTKKLKFKPKVPPQKPKKLTTEPKLQEPKPVDGELMKILRTGQVAAKASPDTNDKSSIQDSSWTPPSSAAVSLSLLQSGVHKQDQSALQIPRAFPVTVNAGMFYSEESDDDDEDDDNDNSDNVEFQETQPSSAECEASTHPAEELDLLKEQDSKERRFLFQLPKSLPFPRRRSVVETKEKATSKEVKEGSNLKELPQGYLGKMLIYKSGKIKMKLGDAMFDVNPGAESSMVQHAVALNTGDKHCCLLGEIENRHVIMTPDVDSLLSDDN